MASTQAVPFEDQISVIESGLRTLRQSKVLLMSECTEMYEAAHKHFLDARYARISGKPSDLLQKCVKDTQFYCILIRMMVEASLSMERRQKSDIVKVYHWYLSNKHNLYSAPRFGKARQEEEGQRILHDSSTALPPGWEGRLGGGATDPAPTPEPSARRVTMNSRPNSRSRVRKPSTPLSRPKMVHPIVSLVNPHAQVSTPRPVSAREQKEEAAAVSAEKEHRLNQWEEFKSQIALGQAALGKLQYCGRTGTPYDVRYSAHGQGEQPEFTTRQMIDRYMLQQSIARYRAEQRVLSARSEPSDGESYDSDESSDDALVPLEAFYEQADRQCTPAQTKYPTLEQRVTSQAGRLTSQSGVTSRLETTATSDVDIESPEPADSGVRVDSVVELVDGVSGEMQYYKQKIAPYPSPGFLQPTVSTDHLTDPRPQTAPLLNLPQRPARYKQVSADTTPRTAPGTQAPPTQSQAPPTQSQAPPSSAQAVDWRGNVEPGTARYKWSEPGFSQHSYVKKMSRTPRSGSRTGSAPGGKRPKTAPTPINDHLCKPESESKPLAGAATHHAKFLPDDTVNQMVNVQYLGGTSEEPLPITYIPRSAYAHLFYFDDRPVYDEPPSIEFMSFCGPKNIDNNKPDKRIPPPNAQEKASGRGRAPPRVPPHTPLPPPGSFGDDWNTGWSRQLAEAKAAVALANSYNLPSDLNINLGGDNHRVSPDVIREENRGTPENRETQEDGETQEDSETPENKELSDTEFDEREIQQADQELNDLQISENQSEKPEDFGDHIPETDTTSEVPNTGQSIQLTVEEGQGDQVDHKTHDSETEFESESRPVSPPGTMLHLSALNTEGKREILTSNPGTRQSNQRPATQPPLTASCNLYHRGQYWPEAITRPDNYCITCVPDKLLTRPQSGRQEAEQGQKRGFPPGRVIKDRVVLPMRTSPSIPSPYASYGPRSPKLQYQAELDHHARAEPSPTKFMQKVSCLRQAPRPARVEDASVMTSLNVHGRGLDRAPVLAMTSDVDRPTSEVATSLSQSEARRRNSLGQSETGRRSGLSQSEARRRNNSRNNISQSEASKRNGLVQSGTRKEKGQGRTTRCRSASDAKSRPVSGARRASHPGRADNPGKAAHPGRPIPDYTEARDPESAAASVERQKQASAAVNIQRIFRGYLVRTNLRQMQMLDPETRRVLEDRQRILQQAKRDHRDHAARLSQIASRDGQGSRRQWEADYQQTASETQRRRRTNRQARLDAISVENRARSEKISVIGPHVDIYQAFNPKQTGATPGEMYKSASTIQKVIRGFLLRRRFTELHKKALKHAPSFSEFMRDYKSLLTRIQRHYGVNRPSTPFDIDQVIDFMDVKKQYELIFDRCSFGGELEVTELQNFFQACDLFPSPLEIDQTYDIVFKGRNRSRSRNLSKREAMEILFHIYIPPAAGLHGTRVSTWMNPIIDGVEAIKLAGVGGVSGTPLKPCVDLVSRSIRQQKMDASETALERFLHDT